MQLVELSLIEAQPFGEFGRNLFLGRAALRERPDGNVLQPWGAFTDLAVTLHAKMVRDDATGDDRFTEAPARFYHEFVRAVHGVAGEHHARTVGTEERLHHDTHARAGEAADALAV